MCHCVHPSAYFEKIRFARKPHCCCECGGKIGIGDAYQYVSGVWDNVGASYKTCLPCSKERRYVTLDAKEADPQDCGPCFGELKEWIGERAEL